MVKDWRGGRRQGRALIPGGCARVCGLKEDDLPQTGAACYVTNKV